MNEVLRKIVSIILIPIVLFSTMSFHVEKHMCMDEVYSVSLLGEAESCGMEMDIHKDDLTNTCTIENENCCADETQFIAGSSTSLEKENKLNVEQLQFLTAFLFINYYQLFTENRGDNAFELYNPPRVVKSFSVLYQVFII